MPDFQYIPDSPIETGLEKARQAATRLDEKYADRLAEELAKLGRKVLPAGADPLEIGVDGMIGRAMDSRRALDDLLEKMMLEAAVLGAKEGNSSLSQLLGSTKAVISLNSAWDLANLTVEQWVRTQHWFSPLSLTQGLSATEQNRIRMLVVDYVTNQRPQAWLRDRIVGDTGLYGRQRAETIARTEVTHAFARGNRAAWADRGVERVSWRTRVDELVCPICGPLHLQEFDVDSDVIPPAHARCRCWIVPAVDRDSIPELPEADASAVPAVLTPRIPNLPNLGMPTEESDLAAKALLAEMKTARGGFMYETSEKLSARVGVRKRDIADWILDPWGTTSNDEDLRSLTVQQRAGRIFGAEFSEWQKKHLDEVMEVRSNSTRRSARLLFPFEEAAGEVDRAIEMTDEAILALYTETQEAFARKSTTHVTLYRGFWLDDGLSAKSGDSLEMGWSNALESWTLDPKVAYEFGGSSGVIISASVPVERIAGTALQGFGTMREREVVVIGRLLGKPSEVVKVLKGTHESMPKGN